MIVINPGRELYPETALTGHSSPEKPCQATITDTDVSILYTNWLQLSRKDLSTGTTAGVYALPAVQSKLRELRRRLAPLALCPRMRNRKTPRAFQSRNSPEVSVFCSVLPYFRDTSVNFHCKSARGVYVPPFPDRPIACSGRCGSQERTSRQAPPLAYTPCQWFRAGCASYVEGSLRLALCPRVLQIRNP